QAGRILGGLHVNSRDGLALAARRDRNGGLSPQVTLGRLTPVCVTFQGFERVYAGVREWGGGAGGSLAARTRAERLG
ncbi:hypothetical protein ACFUOZ_21160, partial [Paenarthrobacter sp. NPDC057355]|uniref:hypothetical protein n=1 Tax=Paenarthrobacter sp. NPDC057355 TaxID=3346105 RepID=UPI00363A7BA3